MKVLLEKRENACYITFNRPEKLNALDKESWGLLANYLESCEKDPEVFAIVLTGKGRAFSAGDDIYAMFELKNEKEAEDFFNTLYKAIELLIELKKPLVCAVNGLAYGGGCEILLFCDIVIAVSDAKFAIPEGKLGLIPPMAITVGHSLLGRVINRLALTGDAISAQEAKQIGLVDLLVERNELDGKVREEIRKILDLDKNSILTIKKYLKVDKEKVRDAVMELARMSLEPAAKERMMKFLNR